MVQDADVDADTRTPQQLLQDVVNTCIALQGSLVTRDVSVESLLSIESSLKSALATSSSHKIRKTGYPVTLTSANSPSTKFTENCQSFIKPPIKRTRKGHALSQEKALVSSAEADMGTEQDTAPIYQLINFRTDPLLNQNGSQDAPFVLTLHDQPQLLTFHKFMSKKDTGKDS